MKHPHSFNPGLLLGLLGLVALLVLNTGLTYRNVCRLNEDAARIAHTHVVMDAIAEVLADSNEAVAVQRGFLLTGDPAARRRFEAVADRLAQRVERVSALTADNPTQKEHVGRLRQMLAARRQALERTAAVRVEQGLPAAIARVVAGDLADPAQAVRQVLARMNAEEERLLTERQAAGVRAFTVAVITTLFTAGTALAAVGLFLWLLARHLHVRELAAAQLAEQGELLQATLTSVGDGVIATDSQGRVTFLNRIAETLTGWTQADAAGVPLDEVFHVVNGDTRQRADNPALRALKDGVLVDLANPGVLVGRDGAERPIDDSASPIRDVGGTVIGGVLVFRDITVRHAYDQRLRASEEHLRGVLDSLGAFVGVMTPDGTLTEANRAALSAAGLAPADVLGKPFADTYWWAYSPAVQDQLRDAIRRAAAGQPSRYDVKVRAAKDRLIDIDFMLNPMVDDQGRVTHLIPSAIDITERKRAEQELRQSEDRFRLLADAMPQVVWIADARGAVQYYNTRVEAFFGMRREADGTWRWQPAIHPDDLAATETAWQTAVVNRTPYQCEHRLRMQDGSYRWHLSRGLPLGLQPPDDIRWYGTATDIHDLKATQEALRESERRERERAQVLQTLLNAAPTPIWISYDRDCREITGNPASYQLLRTPPGGTVSATAPGNRPRHRTFREYRGDTPISPEELPMQTAARGVEVHGAELKLVYTDGDVRHIYGNAVPLRDDLGQPRGAIAAFVDITKLKEAEEGLKEADRRKDEFLAMLAHELRNPLAPIRNAVQLLRLIGLPDPRLEQVRDLIDRQLTHLVRLVDDLLEVSRITRGMIELQRDRVDLARVVQNAVETSCPLLDAGRHELTVTTPPEPIPVDGDPVRLTQVVTNVLNNAAKFTPSGGHIAVTVAREDGRAVVRIKDDGPGIPAAVLPQVFELFTQFSGTRDRSQGGLGIGLALVKRLVEMHGGSVEVHSDGPGTGAEFVIRLPLADAAPAAAERPATHTVNGRGGCRILVVDDNVDAADSLAMVLALSGHDVRTAHDGATGIELVKGFRPAVILLDLGMPVMDGYETARRIRQLDAGQQAKLIALTGWGQEHDRRQTRDAGFDEHLVKPVDPAVLQALLAAASPP
ncbi:MAG: PAS domain S-box protein [Gemmataceae bacterium]